MPESHQFETIFEYANEAILITDKRGFIRRANPAARTLFGYELYELNGQRIETLVPSRYRKDHSEHVSHYHQHQKPRSMGAGIDLFATRKDGTEFPVEVSLSPCYFEDEDMVVAFVIDISERKKNEEQAKNYQLLLEKEVEDRTLILKEAISNLEETKKKLDQSLKKERELNQLKSRFISTASHEFRTPLATVLSSLSLVEKYTSIGKPEKVNRHIDRIKKSVRNLTEILDDLLSVNKIEEGKVILAPHDFELITYLKDMVAEVNIIAKKGQSIKLETPDFDKLMIYQDPKLLRHIVLNLLSNAIKFSNEGTQIELKTSEEENTLFIEIQDRGIGIPEENMENLFTRFFRADNAGQIQGTGLGLSIVKQYSELLGGDVTCQSIINQGTKFVVSIPKNLTNEKNTINRG
ncbi:PAS domain-containing sensor histidine kinase [Jiulongibacter sediminis]|uniref:PAS domain-containing sensor histidine kinase n=1 Tax=Jiulongibacter sediminis TaxID=1605367 RepID=UPI0026EA6093|nr:PAS domain-containing sensor histidine kinase [Jiulongibacter sediminis]